MVAKNFLKIVTSNGAEKVINKPYLQIVELDRKIFSLIIKKLNEIIG